MFPGSMNHVPRDVAALSNSDYLYISRVLPITIAYFR